MKIVQAVGWYYPHTVGGTEAYVAALASRLTRQGHAVEIVTPAPEIDRPLEYVHDGVKVHRFPIARSLTRDEAQGRAPVRGADWLHRWLARARPDVAHFHTLVPGIEVPELQAARAAGARVIATTHASSLGHICARGTMMRWGTALCDGRAATMKCAACELQNRGLPRWAARALSVVPPTVGEHVRRVPGRAGTALGMTAAIAFNRRRQTDLLDAVDRFVLLTNWALDAVVANGAPRDKVALNRLGIGCAGLRKPDPTTRPTTVPVVIGYVGRFDPIKGVYDLARAIRATPRDVSCRFDIRGPLDTAAGRAVRAQLQATLAGDPRVTFGAPLSAKDVPAHLATLDVLCCPSTCLEGGPTVAFEAHAVGTPVIGTGIGGLAETVVDGTNGRLVPPGDWQALAAAFAETAADPTATIDRWRQALPPVRTMDDVTADYLEIYKG